MPGDPDLTLREQLSTLRGLLALSMLMTERRQEEEIIHLVVTAVPALVRARPVGVHLADGEAARWTATTGPYTAASVRAEALEYLGKLPAGGGAMPLRGTAWTWAFALRSLGEHLGHLVVTADTPPPPADLLLLRSLAQQTGTALANARLHRRNAESRDELARTVAALQHKTAIHDRFTQVAAAGGGQDGIVAALADLTGLPACIEDRGGAVLAWHSPAIGGDSAVGDRAFWGAMSERRREQVLQRALRSGRPIRVDGRLLTVARPRADLAGVISLVDPDGRAGDQETVALEHAGTVLAIELARLHSLAETELRLGRDLLSDLIDGSDADAERRARALGHDLRRPHRVIVIASGSPAGPRDDLLLRSRAAVASAPGAPPPLLMQAGSVVVALVADEARATGDRLPAVAAAVGPGCRIGVGGSCREPGHVPRSYREARLALRLADRSAPDRPILRYDDLGVYQLLAESADASRMDDYVRRWLGPLLDYDDRRGSSLVATLARFLECGGNYDATATALCLGRSTVRYRMRRIQELTGHDLGDPDIRFAVQFATRAWTTRNALGSTAPTPG